MLVRLCTCAPCLIPSPRPSIDTDGILVQQCFLFSRRVMPLKHPPLSFRPDTPRNPVMNAQVKKFDTLRRLLNTQPFPESVMVFVNDPIQVREMRDPAPLPPSLFSPPGCG